VIENSGSAVLSRVLARHTPHDRRAKFVGTGGSPIEDASQYSQRHIGHSRTAAVLNAVKQADNFTALQAVDWLVANRGIDKAVQGSLILPDGPQPPAFTRKEFIAGGGNGVGLAFSSLLLGSFFRPAGVNPVGKFIQRVGRPLAGSGGGQRWPRAKGQ